MNLLWSLFIGLVVGVVAKVIMPGGDPGGILITMMIGITGAVVAGLLGRSFGIYPAADSLPGIIASVVGAVFLLAAYRIVTGRRVA